MRARGGLCIADEVQVGYGRLGHYFWGFEQQGVVPDIITVAKGMGNGHPLGAVITTRAIAESLEKEGYFFSSTGGSPVSCVVGMTVLDIMADERLQENARDVGDHLKSRLGALIERLSASSGRFTAWVSISASNSSATERRWNRRRKRQRRSATGCSISALIMQPTGDHLNVLKIKPPLCLSVESADFFADTLETLLSDGW